VRVPRGVLAEMSSSATRKTTWSIGGSSPQRPTFQAVRGPGEQARVSSALSDNPFRPVNPGTHRTDAPRAGHEPGGHRGDPHPA
jgi:hypothetical protein